MEHKNKTGSPEQTSDQLMTLNLHKDPGTMTAWHSHNRTSICYGHQQGHLHPAVNMYRIHPIQHMYLYINFVSQHNNIASIINETTTIQARMYAFNIIHSFMHISSYHLMDM